MNAPSIQLVPLTEAELSPAVQKLLAGPGAAKTMACKGLAPLKPVELITAAYQLTFDADSAVKEAAQQAPTALPDRALVPALAEALPAAVLHFFATKLPVTKIEAFEKILYNPATADATFVSLAARLGERELEIIFQNEARFLRCPAILEALYMNPRARSSSLNRALELAARHGLRPEGIPAFDEIVKSIAEDPEAKTEAADQSFGAVAAATESVAPDADARSVTAADQGGLGPDDAKSEADDKEGKSKSITIDFGRLKLHEKIRLATLGNEYCRQNLLRDPNRLVAMAAIRSPRITDGEVVRAAGNKTISEDVIRYIANQREYLKLYAVKMALVLNPKCPLALSLKFLPYLRNDDIKDIARSKNVASALSTAARKLLDNRSGGHSAG